MGLGNEYESIVETDIESEIKNHLKEGIQKLLVLTNKSIELEEAALDEFGQIIFTLLQELVDCAPLTTKDVEDYVSRAYPEDIYKECKLKGQAVYNKLHKKRGTISRRINDGLKLKFPVEAIFLSCKKEWDRRGGSVEYKLIVYMLAMLEHIATLLLKRASALVEELSKNSGGNTKPVITCKYIKIARNYHEELRKLFADERRGTVMKPAFRTEPAQTYEEAVRRFMSDQANYIRDLQIIVNKIMPIFAKKESGLSEDMVDLLFGNVKEILLFELIFQNDLEEAKEMIRQDSSFHVGVVFVEKALVEDYDVYAYYANNYKDVVPIFEKLLDDPEFVSYLEGEVESLGFTQPYVTDRIIPRFMGTLLKEPLYHLLHIHQTVDDLLTFMSAPNLNTEEDRKNEVEFLKQTMENFARISDILLQIEQDYPHRDNAPHLTPRKAGVLRAYSAFEKIEHFGESYQTFSQICSEHILNGNLYIATDKREPKLKHCYLFDGMIIICARDVNAKATNLRTPFKEKYLVKDLTQINDYGPEDACFDVVFRDTEIKFQAKNWRHKDEWVSALLILTARKVLTQVAQQEETTYLDFYSLLPSQYGFTEPDTDSNIRFIDNKSKSYTSIPTIAQGTLAKLVERVTYHKYTDLALVKQFLTTFRFFAKPREILELLMQRYDIPLPEDLENNTDDIVKIEIKKRLQKEYIKPVQLRVINVMRHWIDYHFDDFEKETELVSIMMGFFEVCKRKQTTMRKWINPLERTIQRKQEHQQRKRGDSVVGSSEPVVWHLSRLQEEYSLFSLHPLEIAKQATLIENEFYRSVTPQELLGSHEEKQGGNMAKMVNFSERFVFWIRQSIVETQNLDERIYVASRVFEVMEYLKSMNNYTGVFEVNSALRSAEVYRLDHTVKKLFKEKEEVLKEVGDWPAMNFKSYKELLKNCDPPCIPFIGIYKTKIMHTQDGNRDRKDEMINLTKFRMIADIISEIKLYQNERYNFAPEDSIQDFLRNLDPFRGRTSDELQTDLYNLSLDIEPKGAPPKAYPRTNKWNITVVPQKVKRSGSLMGAGRAGKSDSVRRHRDSSLSDASEGGLRTPGSKNTVSPGSTRSPKEFFGYKFSNSGRSATSDHESPECSPVLPPSTSEASDDCTEPSPRTLSRADSAEDSPKPPIPARDPKPQAPPVPPVRDPILPPAPPARKKSAVGLPYTIREKQSPTTSPSDDGEYLDTIFNKAPPPPASPKPPPTPPKASPLPPKGGHVPPKSAQLPPKQSPMVAPNTPPKIPPHHPPMPKRLSSTTPLASIIETKERDSSGESLSDIHAAAKLVHIDERSHVPGMVRLPLHGQWVSPGVSSRNSGSSSRHIYSSATDHRDHAHVRQKKNKPPPLSVSTSPTQAPHPITPTRPTSVSSDARKPPPLPPKTASRAPMPKPGPPPLPPRRTSK